MNNQKPCLLFSLCNELFGIDVVHVIRVINLEQLMVIPQSPDFISGAINLEGNVLPVVDLAKKIELGSTEIKKQTKVIIIEIEHNQETMTVGMLIDEVLDVVNFTASQLQASPVENMGFNSTTLEGMFQHKNDFYLILDANKVFEKELATLV